MRPCYHFRSSSSYSLREVTHGSSFSNKRLISLKYEWKYFGEIHERIDLANDEDTATAKIGRLPATIHSLHDTPMERNFSKDAAILEASLKRNTKDERTRFYLANTYNMLDRKEDAILLWAERVALGGWQEERYMSAIYLGGALDLYFRGMHGTKVRLATWEALLRADLVSYKAQDLSPVPISPEVIFSVYKKANMLLPYRKEALFHMARLSRTDTEDLNACTAYAEDALALPWYDENTLLADVNIYRYGVLDELCMCAYYVVNKSKVGEEACRQLTIVLAEMGDGKPVWMHSMLLKTQRHLDAYIVRRVQNEKAV